jgi:hypothetical protein
LDVNVKGDLMGKSRMPIASYDENNACCCKQCRRKLSMIKYPRIKVIDDLVYAQCTYCNHYSPYEFIGSTKKNAIANWNETMLHKDQVEA